MKKKWIYKIVQIVTLTLPMTVYLLVMALIFNVRADAFVGGTTDQVEVVTVDESTYIVALVDDVTFNGQVEKVGDTYGLFIDEDTIVKFNDGYFTFSGEWVNVKDQKTQEQQESKGLKISFSTAVSIFAIVIVTLIVFNKMQFQKKFPRLATLIALAVGTFILFGIHSVIGEILYVFVIATLSWGAYTIEELIFNNILTEEEGKKATSQLTSAVAQAIKEFK